MAERLRARAAEYREQVGPRPFFSADAPWRIPAYRARLEAATELRERIDVGWELAQLLLQAGRSEEALAELDRLAGLAPRLDPGQAARMRALLRPWRATAWLRLAEQRNCLGDHSGESCLMPLRGRGVHADAGPARAAIAVLEEALAVDGDDLAARWLLNLAHMAVGDWPDVVPEAHRIGREAFASEAHVGRFENRAAVMGADVMGLAGGVVLEDLDGDGRLDLATSSWGVGDSLAILLNRGGGRFEDVTAAAGLEGITGGLNLSHADYDGDGDADLLVLRGGWLGAAGRFPPSLLRNDGSARFEDVTEAAGLLVEHPGQTAAWADFDGDGHLDLFLGHEWSGAEPHPSALFRNLGDGRFEDVAPRAGLAELGWVKGAAFGDYDDDGRPDLYVSRLGQPNLLFHNEGPGKAGWRFREVARAAGVQEPRFSFPTWFFDYDNDGRLDLFVGAWDGSGLREITAARSGWAHGAETPRLYRNRGGGRFEDVTESAGLERVLLVMGANHGDIDGDGYEDVYLGTGGPELWTLTPNRMLLNGADGRFRDVTTSGGFGHLQKGHGIAFGDVDGDGDQDVYAVMGGWFSGDGFRNALFVNPGHGHRWLTLRLEGVRSNRSGVGVRVDLEVRTPEGRRRIHRSVGTGGSFGSSSLQQEIGLGDALAVEELRLTWPASGRVQVFRDVGLDRVIHVREDALTIEPGGP
jgi:hypothetical protein